MKKIKPGGSKTNYVGGIYEVDKTSGGSVTHTVTYYPVAGAMRIDSTLYYVLKDHLGSASVATNASGTTVGEQRYNRYSYVLGNPLRYTDPTGHSQCQTQEDCADMGTTPMGTGNPHNGGGGDGGRDGCRHNDPDCQGDGEGKGFGAGPVLGPLDPDPGDTNNPLSEFMFWLNGYDWLQLLDDSATWVDNYGRPFYRHAKGLVPAGFWLEFGLGALTTFVGDLNNPNFTLVQRGVRAGVVGFEDGVVEVLSTRGATFVAGGAGLGTLGTGPGAAIAAGAAFLVTSVLINEAGNAAAGWLNETFLPGYFP